MTGNYSKLYLTRWSIYLYNVFLNDIMYSIWILILNSNIIYKFAFTAVFCYFGIMSLSFACTASIPTEPPHSIFPELPGSVPEILFCFRKGSVAPFHLFENDSVTLMFTINRGDHSSVEQQLAGGEREIWWQISSASLESSPPEGTRPETFFSLLAFSPYSPPPLFGSRLPPSEN